MENRSNQGRAPPQRPAESAGSGGPSPQNPIPAGAGKVRDRHWSDADRVPERRDWDPANYGDLDRERGPGSEMPEEGTTPHSDTDRRQKQR